MIDFTSATPRLPAGRTLYIGEPASREACLEQARAALAAEPAPDAEGQQVHTDFIEWVNARW